MRFREKRKKDIQLDITPIVDMVFNLLIFFALSINFSAAASINLSLPKTLFPEPAPQVPIIQIDSNHTIAVDRAVIDYEGLSGVLAAMFARSGSKAIIIMADETVHHGFVVSVMDMCRQAGFDKISLSAAVLHK